MKLVNQGARLVVRADGKAHGAMRIDVVGTGLRIIFNDEDRRVFPVRA